jgi:trehalose 6-phosphate synthase
LARLVVVSNRVSSPKSGTRAGGLEVAVMASLKRNPGIWFGWSGKLSTNILATRTIEGDPVSFVLTDLPKAAYDEFYYGFANRVLWPILHYRLDLAEFSRQDLSGYTQINEHFADELNEILKPDDVVWVHDYHFLLLAKALRERGHKNRIGFFLHTPFPPVEIITGLPHHERIISALCHYRATAPADTILANASFVSAPSRSVSRPTISTSWRAARSGRRSSAPCCHRCPDAR